MSIIKTEMPETIVHPTSESPLSPQIADATNSSTGSLMDILNAVENFGLPIAFLAIMIWLYRHADNRHLSERREWREEQTKMHEDTHKLVEQTNTIIRDLTEVIARSYRRES